MALPVNTLQQVQRYLESDLAYLENLACFVSTANAKFKNFQDEEGQLGSTTTFDRPPRYTTANSLIATFQPSTQLVQTLTVDQAANTSYAFSAQQFIFNVEEYMDKFGKSAMLELATRVEQNIALNATSAVPVGDINGNPTGALHTESGPYRFFGDGKTAINSYQQLAQMVTNFKNFGAVREGIKVYLPDVIVPAIVGTGLQQFAPQRNDDISMSWVVGDFGTPPVQYYQSNLLPIHVAGNVGNTAPGGDILTVISTNDPTGANITQITFSGATASDANAILSGDMFQFNDGVSGKPNMRFLTYIGHIPCAQPVQFRATANAGADGSGHVVVNILPALISVPGANQNINNNIVAGMQVTVAPSHLAGLVVGGDALFLAMPRLPGVPPFDSSTQTDSVTGVSMRKYYGSIFGQNQQGFVNDCVWGSTLVPDYSMRILIPLQ